MTNFIMRILESIKSEAKFTLKVFREIEKERKDIK